MKRQSREEELTEQDITSAKREKRSAALSSVGAALFLTLLKIIVGLLTGSLGILAEAAHSGLDLVAALVTFFAVRVADQPPDEQHLYGHGKVENLSALVETLLLLLTCVWIIYEAVRRLFFEPAHVEASIWAFAVMAISIGVDVSRSRMLSRVAEKHNSQALEADALHFSTDIWSSAVVIVGLGLVWIGQQLGPEWAWLAKADAVAALAVAAIVVYVSLQLGRRAVAVLLDAAPPGLAERLGVAVAQVPGVQSAGPIRVRQAGASTFVDLAVQVERSASLEEAHQVATAVEQRVRALIIQGDVVVHVDPVRGVGEGLPQSVSALAAQLGLRTHNVHAHEIRGRFYVDLHAEVPPEWTLAQAHERISQLEATVQEELPYVSEVNTHIEPWTVPVLPGELSESRNAELGARIMAVLEESSGLTDFHRLQVRPGPDGYDVVVHSLANANMPIGEAHRLSNEAERRVLSQMPEVSSVLIHMEPKGRD